MSDNSDIQPVAETAEQAELRILKLINGALKDTINNHGPITSNYISSASKRILGMLKNHVTITVIDKP